MGWHWLIGSYRFQLHISDTRSVCCTVLPITWNQTIPCHHILGDPLPLHPYSLPSGNHHTALCAHECQFYIPSMSAITWFLAFSDLLVLSFMSSLYILDINPLLELLFAKIIFFYSVSCYLFGCQVSFAVQLLFWYSSIYLFLPLLPLPFIKCSLQPNKVSVVSLVAMFSSL